MKKVIKKSEIEELDDNKVLYSLNGDNIVYHCNTVQDKPRLFEREQVRPILQLLRKRTLEEREMAAINCYIMGKDKEFDATYTGVNSYHSRNKRLFLLTFELSRRVWKKTYEDRKAIELLKKYSVQFHEEKDYCYVYVRTHCVSEFGVTLDELCENIINLWELNEVDSKKLRDVVGKTDIEMIRKSLAKVVLFPTVFRSKKKTSDFLTMPKEEFEKKYGYKKNEYSVAQFKFNKWVQEHPEFDIEAA